MECGKISIKREIRSNASLPREKKKSDNLNLPLKEPEKEEQNSKLVKQRKLNIRPEIN